MAALAVLRITYSLRSSASCTITSLPRPMNTWRMIGSFLRTAGDIGMSLVDRHVAPAQQHLALGLDRALEFLLARQARRVLLGQEDHADAVFAGRRQFDALPGHFLAVQRVGHLDQDAGAVAHQLVGAHGAAMVQVFQDLQPLLDDGVALLALDVRDEADAAGVMLVGGRIQAVFLQMGNLGSRRHGALLNFWAERQEYCSAATMPSTIIGVRFQLIRSSISRHN